MCIEGKDGTGRRIYGQRVPIPLSLPFSQYAPRPKGTRMPVAILNWGLDVETTCPSEDVEQIEQDDDRNGNADQPEKYAAHGMSPFRQAINSL